MHADHLTTVRFELVTHADSGVGRLELVFQHGEQTAVLTDVLVDLAAAAKNAGRWQWPQAAGSIGDEQAEVLARLIAPWLQRLTQEPVIALHATLEMARDGSPLFRTSSPS